MSELPYKHNVATKQGSSKPLTTNELWLLELWIKSISILTSIPDVLWDMCKSSIEVNKSEQFLINPRLSNNIIIFKKSWQRSQFLLLFYTVRQGNLAKVIEQDSCRVVC